MNPKYNNLDLVSNVTNKSANNLNTEENDQSSRDVVDFVKPDVCIPCKQNNNNNNNSKIIPLENKPKNNFISLPSFNRKRIPGTLYGDIEVRSCVKSSFSTLEKLPIFHFQRKKSDPTHYQTTDAKERPKFVKSASIARLLGNTYSTKRTDETVVPATAPPKSSQYSERFQKCSENHVDEVLPKDFCEDRDISAKAFRTISKGLSKLLWRKSQSVDISAPDPEFKVSYLGNVLTGWAKGDSCIEKPLATLWRNYTQHSKPDVIMRVRVCPSGLKATTRQHGLTEYWSHRITHCSSPKNYPRVFCWIYRHEGRKLKHELRCHAVLCAKESISEEICKTLRENLSRALKEFKRDKINRQNARLSLVNSVYENPSMPRRKILLSVGANNYRPPLERSKSAPRLMSIEEAISEEEEDEDHHDNAPKEQRSCCTVDPLYPAMTLGRRRCKRGHSIRRTGNKSRKGINELTERESKRNVDFEKCDVVIPDPAVQCCITYDEPNTCARMKSSSSTESDDDLDKLLLCNNYDTKSPLAGEFMSYFDMKFCVKTASLIDLQQEDQNFKTFSGSMRNTLSLDDLDSFSDREEEDVFYNQEKILDILHKASERPSNELFIENIISCDNYDRKHESSTSRTSTGILSISNNLPVVLDSDEGSISSGCETASTVTTNLEETQSKTDSEKDHNSLESNSAISDLSVETTIANIRLHTLRSKTSIHKSENDESDSEFSDESGYVEYQEKFGSRSKSVLI